MIMQKYNEKRTVLALVGTSFEPGKMNQVIHSIEDTALADMMQAEAFYFSAKAKECVDLVEKYLSSEDIMLRLTADMLYTFANLTLGDARKAQVAREDVKQCLSQVMKDEKCDDEVRASCIFAYYVISTFLHIPVEEGNPALDEHIAHLPRGQRLFAMSLLAHGMYLKGEYAKAQGMVRSAMLIVDKEYPISMIYLYCVEAMCQMNQKEHEEATLTLSKAWEMAKKDELIEPFIEYHGLLQGSIEACIRKSEPLAYKKIVDGVILFSRGWMKVHNPQTQKKVTDVLTPMEFSIAMLACRDWTNQEIAEHLGLSVNTVKHYVSGILDKLYIEKREQIKEFVNQ